MSRSLRVVLVSHYFPAHRGGVEIVAGRLAVELGDSGKVAIDWFASDCDPPPDARPGLLPRPLATWNFVERSTGLPYPIWSIRGMHQLDTTIRDADVVHLHDFIYLGSIFAFASARRHRKPIVVTQHVGATPYERHWMRALLGAINRTLGARLLGAADQVVFISAAARAYFARFVRFRTPSLHWPNGVDTSIFRPVSELERATIRSTLGIPAGRPLMLFVGRFVAHKGLELLREICRLTPDFVWIFAGWGAMDPDRWGLSNVRVLRGLSGTSLAPLYQAADLLVLPSREGGFPLVVQEAMACGTPALISDATAEGSPAARALLATAPLQESGSATLWTERLRALLREPETLIARRDDLARFALSEWSWQSNAAKYRELFDTLASRAEGHRQT